MAELPPGFVLDSGPSAGPVYGPPPKAAPPPTPFQVEDQGFQRENQARAAADQARQAAKDARDDLVWKAEHNPDGSKKPEAAGDGKPTEYQSKSAGFLGRMMRAEQNWTTVPEGSRDARSYTGQKLHDYAPDVENTLPTFLGGNSSERQGADQDARDFITASLRQESGATINPDEYANQYRIFYPMPGDTEDTIKQKAAARRQVMEGFRIAAGPLAGQVTSTVAPEPEVKKDPTATSDTGNDDQSEGLTGSVTDDRPPGPGDGPPTGGGNPNTMDAAALANDRRFYGDPNSLSGLAALARHGVSLGLDDEAAGVGGFLSNLVQGQNPIDGYKRDRDATRINLDQSGEAWPVMGTLAELLGGGGSVRAVGSAAPTLRRLMGEGATLGGIGGFGSGEGAEGSLINAGVGAAGGAALSGALGVGGRYLANRPRPSVNVDQEVVAAGQAENIPIRQPDARPDLRNKMAEVDTSKYGGPMVREARAADRTAIENRVSEIGGGGNAAPDEYALGSRIQEAGKGYIAKTRAQANRLYDRARQEAGGQTVTARNADAALDQHITELKAAGENSNAGAIRYLEGLRQDIDRGLTIEAAQSIRSNMRGQISERGLTGTDTERRVGEVVSAMTQDLAEQLPQSASQALRAADDFYRQRQEFINGTLKEFMGSRGNPLNAEAAATRLVSMTRGKGNYDRFSSMWRELSGDEQGEVAATVAASLGRKANGDFSISTLIRSLDPSKGINPRTAKLIFGEHGARSLDNLRVIARAKNETATALNNSRTGVVVQEAAGGLKTVLMGGLGFGAAGGPGAVAGVLGRDLISKWGEQRAARMLLNPDFTKLLRNAPNTANPKAVNAWLGRVGGISSIAANDNQAFANAIRQALGQSPGRVAASTDQEQH